VTLRRIVGTGLAVAVIVGAVPLAACGGGGGGGDVDISGSIGNKEGPTAVVERVEQTINVTDNAFAPDTVTIKAGTKVVWKWTGTNPHSIQLSGTTSTEQTSGTYERTFDQTGSSFNYQCGVHKSAMTGKIVIE
jgi:plastocyanin